MRHRRVLTLLTPAVVARDDFPAADGTAITALAPPWTKNTSAATNTNAPAVDSGRVHNENAATTSIYYRNDINPVGADYRLECDIVMRSAINTSAGLVARMVVGANSYYSIRYTHTVGWRMFRIVAGSQAQLGGTVAQTLVVDQPTRLAFDLRGNTLVALVNGNPIIAVVDTNLVSAGKPGLLVIGAETATTGVHVAAWRVLQ